jgi:hypothetical protein
MYDNVENVNITYHIKKKFFILYGFPQEISISVYLICVTDVECEEIDRLRIKNRKKR